jgi:hypothetical protein
MKLSEIWKQYQHYTRDLTEHSRKLAFGTAAICWFFKSDQATFPTMIMLSLLYVILYFLADVLQYLTGAIRYSKFARKEEIKYWTERENWDDVGIPDIDIEVPEGLDKPVFYLFITKFIFLILSFCFLIAEFVRRLSA